MSQTQTFACPSCGAALSAAGANKEIKCPYCGSTVVVPAELRSVEPISIDLSGMQMPDTSKEVSNAAKVAVGIFGLSFLVPAIAGIVITVFVLIFTCAIVGVVMSAIPH
jgi:DNA-directed RNA polymerase subunit RPC12/RpoP